MVKEERKIKLVSQGKKQSEELLEIFEEAPNNEDMVMLRIGLNGQDFCYINENFFDALLMLRQDLEEMNIQINCNGAALDVYPSPMSLSMGNGRLAYKLQTGKQAKSEDLVELFDCDFNLNFVSIDEQQRFYKEWLNSLG
ncbi:hypothetical protein V7146_20325 [Gottfriedia acidiceleris]|uniref:hypothetical protein n=1 Tax=Gottfriedia acidiceleris TaxID=371036 RepID=UPI002FFE897F